MGENFIIFSSSHVFAVECWSSCVCITLSVGLVKKRNRICYLFVQVNTGGHLYNRSWGKRGRMTENARRRNEEICNNR